MADKQLIKEKLQTKISHDTSASGVIGQDEYKVEGENKLRVVTDFTSSGVLTVQGRINQDDSWTSLGTLASGGDNQEIEIATYDYVRFNFTTPSGSAGEVAVSAFFSQAGGGNAFSTFQTTSGTSPVATAGESTITFTAGSNMTITGDSSTDTITFAATGGSGDVSGPVSSTDNAVTRWNGTGGDTIQDSSVLIDDNDNVSGIANLTYTGQMNSPIHTLSDAATVATDCNNSNKFTVTLAGNRTLGAPTNLKDGGEYTWVIKQDATGGRTLAYNAVFKFQQGVAPTLSTAANAVDILTGFSDGTNVYVALTKDYS